MKYLAFSILLTFFSISLSHAQNLISASSGSKYVGQFKKVYGYEYERKTVRIKGQKDLFQELIYLSDSTLNNRQFIVVITDKVGPNHQPARTISHEELLKDKMPQRVQASGKIILLKGKPAIIVDDPDNYIIFQRVD
ncbi:hypothetical protein [Mucilaginibacter paludis]|uniref:Uncharacterized protein n=1 Tax=Mucilaginibacter paludis DSM 18603 TaxID=714943 RepID=H1YHZ3_9SPHI|nr:hypothetical protein [Mucilaginibacter paludis]EHQ25541.1 hypothetical protein Mucpa_1381 [Mucilaginibacter paludis DSM 18603]